jgi:hypothetical protein
MILSNERSLLKPNEIITSQNIKEKMQNSTLISFKNAVGTYANIYIKETDMAKKRIISTQFTDFLKSGRHSLNAKDQHGFTIAYYFGMEADEDVCSFIESHGAELTHIISGAIMSKNLVFADKLKNRFQKEKNGALCVLFPAAASYIGDQALVEHFMQDILDKRNELDDVYEVLADSSARGGHKELTESLLQKTNKNKLLFMEAACAAAWGGYKELTEYFLSQTNLIPNFNRIAGFAARGGHKNLAEYFLEKIVSPEAPDYNKMASQAIMGGNLELTDYFLAKSTPSNQLDYNSIASCAVSWGHRHSADQLLARILPQMRQYKRMAHVASCPHLHDYYNTFANIDTNLAHYRVTNTEVTNQLRSAPIPSYAPLIKSIPANAYIGNSTYLSTHRSPNSILAAKQAANLQPNLMEMIRQNQRRIEELEKRVAELESASMKPSEITATQISPSDKDEETTEQPSKKIQKRKH